jgi:hypothetical protein
LHNAQVCRLLFEVEKRAFCKEVAYRQSLMLQFRFLLVGTALLHTLALCGLQNTKSQFALQKEKAKFRNLIVEFS